MIRRTLFCRATRPAGCPCHQKIDVWSVLSNTLDECAGGIALHLLLRKEQEECVQCGSLCFLDSLWNFFLSSVSFVVFRRDLSKLLLNTGVLKT